MTKEEMFNDINRWKNEKKAVILAHYYQRDEIQEIADYVGDSLALAQIAAKTEAEILVFCGVHFMAETAKILSPDKKVLFPVMEAGCSMANMLNEIQLEEYKKNNPNTIIVAYVNSTAKVKALSDVCVTSSNALKIIDYYQKQGKKILYCPDQNLGKYAMKLKGYKFDVWNGFCCIHHNLKPQWVDEMKQKHPDAEFVAHPECQLKVLEKADYVGSTKQLIEYVTNSNCNEFIVGTEMGVIYEMKRRNPQKNFIILSETLKCYDMKLTTLEDLYKCLRDESNEIIIDTDTATKAKKCLDKMLELS
ncbi:MAG: quinolinate synthase NadA [Anaeroplasma sp.]